MVIKKQTLLITLIVLLSVVLLSILVILYANDRSNIQLSLAGSGGKKAYELIVQEYPEYTDFDKQTGFAGTRIIYQRKFFDQYIGFIVNGSGLPIVAADCFKIDMNNNITKKSLQHGEVVSDTVDLIDCKLVEDNK